jgi:hypothetical protein
MNMMRTGPKTASSLYAMLAACLLLTGVVSGGFCSCTSSTHQEYSGLLIHEFMDASGPRTANRALVPAGLHGLPGSHHCCSDCAALPLAVFDSDTKASAVPGHWDTNRQMFAALPSADLLLQGNNIIPKLLALDTLQTTSQLRDISTVVLVI